MKVIGYIRVSTQEQADGGVSLAAQRAKLEQYAGLYDLDLGGVLEDAGQSAKSLKRPGLEAALSALRTGDVEGLLVAKLDRLTRSVRDLGTLLDSYFAKRYSLMCVAEQVDTRTATGRMMLNLMTTMAQWEREIIGERTSTALQHLKSTGRHVGSPGLGKRMVGGQLRDHREEAVTVSRILELREEGLTLKAIAGVLSLEGRTTKRGGKWAAETVRLVLSRARQDRSDGGT